MGTIYRNGKVNTIIKNGKIYGYASGSGGEIPIEIVEKTNTITTISTGGNDASISIDYYEDGTLIDSTGTILYSTVNNRTKAINFHLTKIWYDATHTNWRIEALCDCYYNDNIYTEGETIRDWSYAVSVDFDVNNISRRLVSSILKGTTDPTSSQGNNGQIYLKYTDYSSLYDFYDYLEVGNTQGAYINTGVACTSNAYFEVDFNFTGSHSDSRVFGCGHGGGAMFLIQSTVIDYISVGVDSSSSAYQLTDTSNRHKYKANNDGIYIDDALVSTNVHWSEALPERHYNLFAIDWDNTNYYATNARVYSCKIWNGNTIVRHFLPAMRKSDNAIGMLDIIDGILYTNDGSGSFNIGGNIINAQNMIIDSFAKVNNSWQNLIGTDINDIDTGGSSEEIKNELLFTNDDIINGYYIDSNSGNPIADANSKCTDFVDCSKWKQILLRYNTGWTDTNYNAWYDENKIRLSGLTLDKDDATLSTYSIYNIPNGAKYFRISWGNLDEQPIAYGINIDG